MIRKVLRRERHLHEECGVFGLFSPETADVASLAYYGLFALQHRGQAVSYTHLTLPTICSV